MTPTDQIIRGIQVIQAHAPNNNACIRCEHDELIAGSLEWGIPEDQMANLGWDASEEYDGWVYSV